ncbi:MAG: tetratricopeptide repeat protein, partial [Gammaproteobacteria bacterium]|nr:tetratricopeptide repeat protein [Gammaproteobacteria bacterium]
MKDFNEALNAYQAGDYAEAIRIWTALAEQGDVRSQYNLGVLYDAGEVVPKNDWEAAMWFERAAEQGYADAQFNLGVMYDIG